MSCDWKEIHELKIRIALLSLDSNQVLLYWGTFSKQSGEISIEIWCVVLKISADKVLTFSAQNKENIHDVIALH